MHFAMAVKENGTRGAYLTEFVIWVLCMTEIRIQTNPPISWLQMCGRTTYPLSRTWKDMLCFKIYLYLFELKSGMSEKEW